MCLTLSPTIYATLSTTRVFPPLNPGVTPVIPTGTTGPEAASIRYAHDAATLAFNTFSNVDRALRQQLISAVKDTFLRVLHKPHRRYSRSSLLDMLTHLYETYAVISKSDWLVNDKRFCKPYSPTVLIKVAWQQIDDAGVYANAASTPYSIKQVDTNSYQLVFNSGIFAADCQDWNKRVSDNKTLPHLKFFSWLCTGSGASCCETTLALTTAPHTTPPHTQTTGTCNKRQWTSS